MASANLTDETIAQHLHRARHSAPVDGIAVATELARALVAGGDSRRHVCAAVCSATGADWCALLEPEDDELVVSAAQGLAPGLLHQRFATSEGGTGAVFASGASRFSADARHDPLLVRHHVEATGAASLLHEPVRRGGTTVGVLVAGWRAPAPPPSPATRRLLELLVLQGAVAIEHDARFARLAREARTDPLTGLANRRAWEEHAPRELARAARHGLSATLAVADLDDFKAYNDTRGHPAGDALLRDVAARWRAELRAADILARFGGDEFGLLLVPSERDSGPAIVRRLLERLPPGVSGSAGVVAVDGSTDLADLVARADAALYRAKRHGGAHAVIAT